MKRRIGILAAGLGAAFNIGTVPAQALEQPPAPGQPRPPLVVTPTTEVLANGLRVIVAPRPGVGLVTAALYIRSGSEVDPPQRAGLADLTATLLTRGTRSRTAPAIAQAAETLGGSLDSGAGWDRARVAITVTRARLPQALDLLADVVLQPRFAPAELERARRQAIDGLKVAYSEPGTIAQLAAVRALFGTGTYGEPRAGTPDSLARIKRADLSALHTRWYRPDNAIVVFAGDIDARAAIDLARRSFGNWARPSEALPAVPRTAPQGKLPALVLVDMPGAGQAGVVAALPAVPRNAPDYYAGVVANALLGGSSSSRLAVEIRVKRGLTYHAGSSLDARRAGGLMVASVQTNNPTAAEVVELTRGEIARLGATPVEPAELAARVAYLIGAYARSLETTSGVAARIGELALHDIDLAEIGRVVARFEAVTATDVQRFAATHWPVAAARFAVAGEAREFAAALRQAMPTALSLTVGELDFEQPGLRK